VKIVKECEYLLPFYEIIVREYFIKTVEIFKQKNEFPRCYLSDEELTEIKEDFERGLKALSQCTETEKNIMRRKLVECMQNYRQLRDYIKPLLA